MGFSRICASFCNYERWYTISYINAESVLPEELLREIRQYIEGRAIYIPRSSEKREGWGKRSGTRAELDMRNREIADEYNSGVSVEELSLKYCLCPDSIRKILRGLRQS